MQDLNTQQKKVETPDSKSRTSYEQFCDHQYSYVSAKNDQNSRSDANLYSIKAKLADDIRGYSELLKNNNLIYSREIKNSSDF